MADPARHEIPAPEPLIRQTPGVCGGDACVRRTRIAVWMLASLRRQGATDSQILDWYDGQLTPADLHTAWDYEHRHRDLITKLIRENEALPTSR